MRTSRSYRSTISFLVKIRRHTSTPCHRRQPTGQFSILRRRTVTFPNKLRSRRLHIVNRRNRDRQLTFRAGRRQRFRSIVRAMVSNRIRTTFTSPLNRVIRRRILSELLSHQTSRTIVGLFNPARRNFRHLQAVLVRSLIIRVIKYRKQSSIRVAIQCHRDIRRRTSATIKFRHTRLLRRPTIQNLNMTRHGGHINNINTNRVSSIRSTRITRRRTRNLIFINGQLRLNARASARHIHRHRRNGRVQYKGSNRANHTLTSSTRRFISLLLT